MAESAFESLYPAANRVAAMRAANIVALYGLPKDAGRDLAQEALLELWRKGPAFDERRGSWRTFAEQVVANRMTSLVRRMHSERSGQFREDPLENVLGLAAPNDRADLRADVTRVLAGVSQFDRSVAECLVGHSAIETSQTLGVSRATVYRAIGRLRAAFTGAGLSPRGHEYQYDTKPAVAGA